jgi:long-chain acyl-CoA synthetase
MSGEGASVQNPWDRRLGVWYIAEDHPDAVAIADAPGGLRLTYGELAAEAHQLANALVAAGKGPGDIVALAFANGAPLIRWQLACEEIGIRYIMLNPALAPGEVRAIADHAGISGVAVDRQHADRVTDLTGDADLLRVASGGHLDGFTTEESFVADHPTTPPARRTLGGAMVYTSGTTGKPKGIWRPLPEIDPSVMADAMKTFGHAFRFLPFDGPHLVSAGMYHAGCQAFYRGALNVGQALVIMERFRPDQALELIDQHRVTTAYMVPTQFVRFLGLPDAVREKFDVSSLQSVVHSAAPCPREVKEKMMAWWGPVIWETYGGTEGAATIAKPHRWLEKPGTVGRPVRGVAVRILDDDGNEVPPGTVGAVYIDTGDRNFEYLDDSEATDSVYRGKAFTIGDLGYLDEDGYLFISDRAKDMIITGGVNVYPAEVEGLLVGHDAVADVAVIGIPDDEWGESVRALVELADGYSPSDELADELVQYCRDRLAHFKCPRSVEFRVDLPRTEAGKLMKRQLRDEHWEAAGRRV